MTTIEHKIIEKIGKEGPITFKTFMDMALYCPGLGYYTSQEIPVGKRGDFYTSPHLHRIFGAMIGRQLEEMWETMGKPAEFHAVEIGGGSGYLCKDMLDYLKDRKFFNSLRYVLVELNDILKDSQQRLLSDYRGQIKWTSSLKELDNVTGCIFSNELIDALPVHLIEMGDNLEEISVGFDGRNFIEHKLGANTHNLLKYLKDFNVELLSGYRTEINLKARDWLTEISGILREGFVITIDYGYTAEDYYDRERTKGTLLCYYQHQINENPYEHIGKQDITAHVNFSSLKKWGEESGLKTTGFCSQGTFLVALGIDEVITELCSPLADHKTDILKIKGLIVPQGMGESHKVLIQQKGKGSPELRGFSIRNQKKYL